MMKFNLTIFYLIDILISLSFSRSPRPPSTAVFAPLARNLVSRFHVEFQDKIMSSGCRYYLPTHHASYHELHSTHTRSEK